MFLTLQYGVIKCSDSKDRGDTILTKKVNRLRNENGHFRPWTWLKQQLMLQHVLEQGKICHQKNQNEHGYQPQITSKQNTKYIWKQTKHFLHKWTFQTHNHWTKKSTQTAIKPPSLHGSNPENWWTYSTRKMMLNNMEYDSMMNRLYPKQKLEAKHEFLETARAQYKTKILPKTLMIKDSPYDHYSKFKSTIQEITTIWGIKCP